MSSSAPMQQAKTEAAQPAQRQPSNASTVQSEFTDQRPQATAQRQLQDTANNSPQSHQLNSFQQMAKNSSRSMQLKAMSAIMNAPAVQRVEEDDDPLQAKSATKTAQREAADAAEAPKPNNTGLPDNLKSGIESLSGMSMDHVKVHYNSAQPAQLNAHAYAQGSEIHVAPGQERHLPHEAWHVVQQAQGRVKPTMQMKAGVPVNDDAGLEHEADVMGAKSLQMTAERQNIRPDSVPALSSVIQNQAKVYADPIQRFKVEKAPETKQIFSVSDDGGMLTGMGTPNHDLYVDNQNKVAKINQAAAASPLNFIAGAHATLFHKPYYPVSVKFTPVVNTEAGRVNMQDKYERIVAPKARTFREECRQRGLELNGAMDDIDAGAINVPLKTAVSKMELFKKLILANLSNAEGGLEDADAIEDSTTLVSSVESLLYSVKITKAAIQAVADHIGAYFDDESPAGRFDYSLILRDTIVELGAALVELHDALPDDNPINLMSFHLVNFQAAQIEALNGPDNVLLYRACDVTASTILGNKITSDNAQNLKTYSAGSGAFHYAAKVLNSGADWVSLEGFAAGAREQGFIGITDDTSQYNIDNSWQYIMYGSKQDEAEACISGEDKYFESYTDLRYRLKGIDTHKGRFDLSRRNQLIGKEIGLPAIQKIFPVPSRMASLNIFADTPQQKTQALVLRLKNRGVLTHDMRVANPPQLSLGQLQDAGTGLTNDLLFSLYDVLKGSITSPRIQLGRSSDLANIIAWRSYMGRATVKEFDEQSIYRAEMEQQDQIVEGKDPRVVSAGGWSTLATEVASVL